MNTNETNAAQTVKIKIEATLPLPEAQPDLRPTKPFCTDCSSCGRSGKKQNGSPLNQAAEILMKLATGHYTQQQAEGIPEVIESLLRRHYGRQP